ncbi:hypothetical protein AN401_02695 [Zobellella denitrificans]|uniref:Uncharacterized protein n=1 Tax=Zobellella denitrificans TaxID=347534 RepID=A0A291HLC7_9GAMM|nr:hypothetical protein [Zobellella denitrificans]ATG72901.1 hypothetical protein AN401_02695 [Zobellella denitrificans]
MKKTILLISAMSFSAFGADFVHPLKFGGSEAEKKQVVEFIKVNVKETYTKIGMGDPMTLRMMEQEELNSFKRLTQAQDGRLLDNVIRTYCGMGMCNYATLLMMYNEQANADSQELEW